MDAEPWYSARCIFRYSAAGSGPACYEERIILLRADSFEHALHRAEAEAQTYAGSLKNIAYLECVDVYHLFEETIGDGTEIFSLVRDSELGAADYVSRFFQTGSERSQDFGPEESEPEATDVPEGR